MKIKGLTNPEKKIVMFVGALKMKTFVESLQKQTMFQTNFRHTAKIGLYQIFQWPIFYLSH